MRKGAGTVRALVRAGADPDGANADGTTPLHAAAAWGHADVVRQLLAQGADPGLREDDGEGCSPLERARNGHRTRTVEHLLAAGARSSDETARAATTLPGWWRPSQRPMRAGGEEAGRCASGRCSSHVEVELELNAQRCDLRRCSTHAV
ncbi:ankyrin repeat domain-containing protein [Streptomyces hirsutus]|uniref:ankyrin repeat domain-containing protein n=1 Tax=Streptomyces hirsutus TaxID=35620 RepID=UPI0036BF5521